METYQQPSPDLTDPQAADWERTWALFTHLTVFLAVVIPVPVVGALVMWLIRRHESPFADDHGKEAVNFQITLVIYGVIVFLLSMICIGAVLAIPLALFGIICPIIGAVAASKGRFYRYPMCLRFVG